MKCIYSIKLLQQLLYETWGFAVPHSTGWRQSLQEYISLCNEVGSHVVKSFTFPGTLMGTLPLHWTAHRYQSAILTFFIIIYPLVVPSKWEVLQWGSCCRNRWPKRKQSVYYKQLVKVHFKLLGTRSRNGGGMTTVCSGTVLENLIRLVDDSCQLSFPVHPAVHSVKITLTILLKAE